MYNKIIGIVCVLLLSLITPYAGVQAQVKKSGNTFSIEKQSNKKSTTLVQTDYYFETSEGILPIYVNYENGRCYVIRTSKKTGKQYNQPLKEDVCKAVCKELGIKYSYKSKKKDGNNSKRDLPTVW